MPRATVSADEIARFDALATQWWDPNGPMRPLHRMNPARISWIAGCIERHFPAPLGLRVLDVGCGAGLAAEAMARRGFNVLGIDAAEGMIAAARTHAEAAGFLGVMEGEGLGAIQSARPYDKAADAPRLMTGEGPSTALYHPGEESRGSREPPVVAGAGFARDEAGTLAYRVATVDDLQNEGLRFPIILALEVIEHVPDQPAFVHALAALLEPGGLLVLSTLNRTGRAFIAAKIGAEYLLHWLPVGTHDWRKFVTPAELGTMLRGAGLRVSGATGLAPDPLSGQWRRTRGLSVNYFIAAAG